MKKTYLYLLLFFLPFCGWTFEASYTGNSSNFVGTTNNMLCVGTLPAGSYHFVCNTPDQYYSLCVTDGAFPGQTSYEYFCGWGSSATADRTYDHTMYIYVYMYATSGSYSFNVTGSTGLEITSPTNDGAYAPSQSSQYDVTAGQVWTCQLAASGGTPPYSWYAAGNSTISGTTMTVHVPNSSVDTAFGEGLTCSDSAGHQVSISLLFKITTGNSNELTITAPDSIEVESGGSVDSHGAATGGTQPYTWSSDGALPWVSLSSDGTISITNAPEVTEDTEFSFMLTVTDSNDESDTVEVPITVTVGGGGEDDSEIDLPELKFWKELKKKIMPEFGSITDDDILINFTVSTPVKDFPFYFSMAESDNPAVMVLRDDIRPKLRLFFGLVLVIIFIVALCRILKK